MGFQEVHGSQAQILDLVKSLQSTHFIGWTTLEFDHAFDSQSKEHVLVNVHCWLL